MLSKRIMRATGVLLLALTALGCARALPWRNRPRNLEVNVAFTLENNLIRLGNVRIDNFPGIYVLGTATFRTVVDDDFPLKSLRSHTVQLTEKMTLRTNPARLELGSAADAVLGAELWGRRPLTIDYRSGLVTDQRYAMERGMMKLFSYSAGPPRIEVVVNGTTIPAIVDTSSPDTLTLPGNGTRGRASVSVADTNFGLIDVGYGNVTTARIGNRLLSRFLVTIDYGRNVVGLWRDPRIAL